jgi:membrane protein
VAFNVLLAGVPFLLLLSSGLGYVLGGSPDEASRFAGAVVEALLPEGSLASGTILTAVVEDIVRTRALAGVGGAIGFLWFSSQLFASLRSVMQMVFDHGRERSFLRGKLWDFHLTITSLVLLTAWVVASAFLVVTGGRLGAMLEARGLLTNATTGMEYLVGRALAIAVVIMIFFSLYRWLPRKRTPWRTALLGALAATLLFEIARWAFAMLSRTYPPGSVYTGTMGALIFIVFWTYYSALTFVLGAEFAASAQRLHLAWPTDD